MVQQWKEETREFFVMMCWPSADEEQNYRWDLVLNVLRATLSFGHDRWLLQTMTAVEVMKSKRSSGNKIRETCRNSLICKAYVYMITSPCPGNHHLMMIFSLYLSPPHLKHTHIDAYVKQRSLELLLFVYERERERER